MALFTLGINHRTAPLTVREQVVFHAEELRRALGDLAGSGRVLEAAILSTCNRTELYCQADDPREVMRLTRRQERELRAWLYGEQRLAETLASALRQVAQEVEGATIVFVVCDRGDRYLSSGVFPA